MDDVVGFDSINMFVEYFTWVCKNDHYQSLAFMSWFTIHKQQLKGKNKNNQKHTIDNSQL